MSENSLVAMDFSGRTGRVIDNPVEAQSAAMEEGHTWRVSSYIHVYSGNELGFMIFFYAFITIFITINLYTETESKNECFGKPQSFTSLSIKLR